jgi:hypothetical protein
VYKPQTRTQLEGTVLSLSFTILSSRIIARLPLASYGVLLLNRLKTLAFNNSASGRVKSLLSINGPTGMTPEFLRLVMWNLKQIRCNGFHVSDVVENTIECEREWAHVS